MEYCLIAIIINMTTFELSQKDDDGDGNNNNNNNRENNNSNNSMHRAHSS
jgi:hypothetical protein